ncbi:MAG TPA: hypothetical protein VGN20_05405 [Mucilaginibacter sp.]|jgi:hypothetical protein
MIAKKQIMIGLAKVITDEAYPNVLNGAEGAFVNVLCFASNKRDFRNQAKKEMKEIGVILVRIENIQTVSERLQSYEIDDSLLKLIPTITIENKIKVGVFHSY